MIEAVFSLCVLVFELAVAMIAAIVEFFMAIGVFIVEGATLLDAFLLIFVMLAELIVWGLKWTTSAIIALLRCRKPPIVNRPVFWRPVKRDKKAKE